MTRCHECFGEDMIMSSLTVTAWEASSGPCAEMHHRLATPAAISAVPSSDAVGPRYPASDVAIGIGCR